MAGGGLLPGGARGVSRCRLAARSDRALALADSRRGLRRLSVSQAFHLALPSLARRRRRARSGGGLGGRDRQDAVAGVVAWRGRRLLGGGVRPLLLAARRWRRSRTGPRLGSRSVRRWWRVPR